ncbi:MAG: hypothetical protein ABGZ23_15355, partial [Fuerstiella sp.]
SRTSRNCPIGRKVSGAFLCAVQSDSQNVIADALTPSSPDGKILKLIAWLEPDGNGKHLYPARLDRTLMDVTGS